MWWCSPLCQQHLAWWWNFNQPDGLSSSEMSNTCAEENIFYMLDHYLSYCWNLIRSVQFLQCVAPLLRSIHSYTVLLRSLNLSNFCSLSNSCSLFLHFLDLSNSCSVFLHLSDLSNSCREFHHFSDLSNSCTVLLYISACFVRDFKP